MTHFEALKTLAPKQLEKFLDQVFLTGMNTGYHSLVDPDIHDGNPFDASWLNAEVEGSSVLVEDEAGETLIIDQLAAVVMRIVEFDADTVPDNLCWQIQVVLPKSAEYE